MRNRNSENPHARSGRAVTDPQPPMDGAHARDRRPEPSAYVAPSYADATLAGPAAGEVTDYYDEGEPSGGAQQGADRTRNPTKDVISSQGPKTRAANRRMARSGSPDQGTH
jgi:hypothetical protein